VQLEKQHSLPCSPLWIFLHSLQIDPRNCAPDPGSPDWPGQAAIASNSDTRAEPEPEQVSSKYWFLDPAFHFAFFNYSVELLWLRIAAAEAFFWVGELWFLQCSIANCSIWVYYCSTSIWVYCCSTSIWIRVDLLLLPPPLALEFRIRVSASLCIGQH
jgi:hypothetical protein